MRTIKKRGLNEKPSTCLQQGPNPGEHLSDCHLNKQRLINSLGAEVNESVGLMEETQTALPYRILLFSGEAVKGYKGFAHRNPTPAEP